MGQYTVCISTKSLCWPHPHSKRQKYRVRFSTHFESTGVTSNVEHSVISQEVEQALISSGLHKTFGDCLVSFFGF